MFFFSPPPPQLKLKCSDALFIAGNLVKINRETKKAFYHFTPACAKIFKTFLKIDKLIQACGKGGKAFVFFSPRKSQRKSKIPTEQVCFVLLKRLTGWRFAEVFPDGTRRHGKFHMRCKRSITPRLWIIGVFWSVCNGTASYRDILPVYLRVGCKVDASCEQTPAASNLNVAYEIPAPCDATE